MTCDWRPTGEFDRHGKPYHRCTRCPRRWAFHKLAAEPLCGVRGTFEPAAKPVTAAELPCVYRRDRAATVPCGVCGARDKPVAVFVCAKFGACTINRVGRSEAQKVEGKFPATCLGCDARVEPAG